MNKQTDKSIIHIIIIIIIIIKFNSTCSNKRHINTLYTEINLHYM